jgi:hypothetical protein
MWQYVMNGREKEHTEVWKLAHGSHLEDKG